MFRPVTNILQAPTNKGEGGYVPNKDPNSPPGIGDHLLMEDGGPSDRDLQIIDSVRRIWIDEDTVYAPYLQRSLHAYELYNNTYSVDSAKDEWQSRMKMPYAFMTVERWVAALSKLIETGDSWIETDSVTPQLQIFHNLCKNLMMFMLRHDTVQFFPRLREAFKIGLLSGNEHVMVTYDVDDIPMKTDPLMDDADSVSTLMSAFSDNPMAKDKKGEDFPFISNPQMPKLVLKVISSGQVRLDSTGQNRYKMWKTRISKAELRATSLDRGYDLDAVERAISRMGTEDSHRTSVRRRIETGLNKGVETDRQQVELTHFEGTLDDPILGVRIFKQKYCVIAEGLELILPETELPQWDKESIIVSAPFIQSPSNVYGKSPITESIDAFYMRHNFQNSLNDYMQRTMNPPILVDQDLLARSDLTEDMTLYPGKRIDWNSSGNPTGTPIKAMVQPDLPPGLWQYIQFFQSMMGEVTGMTQELMGMPRTRGRITGMEYNTRQSEAGSWIGFVFNDLEDQFLTKLIRVIFLRTLQYMPDAMWKAWVTSNIPRLIPQGSNIKPEDVQKWGQDLIAAAEWNAKDRYMKLGGFFKFKIRIFSNQAERQMEIEKGSFLLNTLAKIPGAMQAIRLPEIIRYLVRAFGWDPELILNSNFIENPDLDQATMNPDELIDKLRQAAGGGGGQGDMQPPNIVDPTIMDMLGHPGGQAPGGQPPGGQPPSSGSPFPGGPQQTSPNMPQPPGPMGF